MEKHTWREYIAWQAWLDEEWNKPEAGDFYLMQIAAEVRRVLAKNPNQIRLGDFKIEFGKKQERPPLTPEEVSSRAKAKWSAAVGLK